MADVQDWYVGLQTLRSHYSRKHGADPESKVIPCERDALGSCAEEDCSGAAGEMGKGESGEIDGIIFWGMVDEKMVTEI